MKIRNGLVSNSSSSSYIITIKNMTIKDFSRKLMCEYSYDLFNLEKIIESINITIEENKRYPDRFQDYAIEQKNVFENLYKNEELNDQLIIDTILKYNRIKLDSSNSDIVLQGNTSIHNSYNESMPSILREICLFFSFDESTELVFERIADDEW